MLSDFPRLLENVDVLFAKRPLRIFLVVLIDKLRKAQGTRHSRRTATDYYDVCFHLGANNV